MKKKIIFIICFLVWVSTASCQDNRNLKIFLPEGFQGYGAVIFDGKETCTKDNQTILVQTDSLGIGYACAGDCFPQSGVRGHFFYYMKKGNDYIRINTLYPATCEEARKLQGIDVLYDNGGQFMSTEGYSVLIFHIGKCDDSKEIFYMDSPEDKKIKELCDVYIERLKAKKQ